MSANTEWGFCEIGEGGAESPPSPRDYASCFQNGNISGMIQIAVDKLLELLLGQFDLPAHLPNQTIPDCFIPGTTRHLCIDSLDLPLNIQKINIVVPSGF